jgi:DNA-directed RNA polymerase II subunit RPB1
VLYPDDALKILERISNEDCELMGFKPALSRPEFMIIKNLAVAPPPVRPSVAMTNTLRSEDDLTYAYQKIIQSNNLLKN